MSETNLTIPANSRPTETHEIASRLVEAGVNLDVTLPDDDDELIAAIVAGENDLARRGAVQGVRLLELRRRLAADGFRRALESQGIALRSAERSMSIARFLMKAEPEVRRDLLKLSRCRLDALASIDADELADFQDELDLDAVAVMPVRMLRSEVRRLRNMREDLAVRNGWLREENDSLRRRHGMLAGREYPASVVRARQESAAHAEQAIAEIGSLSHQWRGLLEAPDLGGRSEGRADNLKEGLRPVALQLASVAQSALAALDDMYGSVGEWLPEGAWKASDQPWPLTAAELRDLDQWRQIHMGRADLEAECREAERAGSGRIRRGRGRPRKTRPGARSPKADRGAA